MQTNHMKEEVDGHGKGESSEEKGNTIQLTDDGREHRFEVHIQS